MINIDGHEVLTSLEEKVAPGNAAILVIDMQNDFTQPGGFCDKLGIDISPMIELGHRLERFLNIAREQNIMIVHIHAIYDKKYMSAPMHERLYRHKIDPYCQSGTDGVLPHPGLEPNSNEPIIIKHRFDAFYDTELDIVLKTAGIKSIIATGVATQACVDSTCRHAYFKGYYVVSPSNLTGGANRKQLEAVNQTMDQAFGITTTDQEIIDAWEKMGSE